MDQEIPSHGHHNSHGHLPHSIPPLHQQHQQHQHPPPHLQSQQLQHQQHLQHQHHQQHQQHQQHPPQHHQHRSTSRGGGLNHGGSASYGHSHDVNIGEYEVSEPPYGGEPFAAGSNDHEGRYNGHNQPQPPHHGGPLSAPTPHQHQQQQHLNHMNNHHHLSHSSHPQHGISPSHHGQQLQNAPHQSMQNGGYPESLHESAQLVSEGHHQLLPPPHPQQQQQQHHQIHHHQQHPHHVAPPQQQLPAPPQQQGSIHHNPDIPPEVPIADEEDPMQSQFISGAFSNVAQGLSGHYRQAMMQYWQDTINNIEHEDHEFKVHQLPLARIKKVMKSDEDVRMISAEAPILFAKGCDIFITELTMRAWIHAEENKRRTLQRSDIACALQKSDMFDFLIDIVPREEAFQNRKTPNSNTNSTGFPAPPSLPSDIPSSSGTLHDHHHLQHQLSQTSQPHGPGVLPEHQQQLPSPSQQQHHQNHHHHQNHQQQQVPQSLLPPLPPQAMLHGVNTPNYQNPTTGGTPHYAATPRLNTSTSPSTLSVNSRNYHSPSSSVHERHGHGHELVHELELDLGHERSEHRHQHPQQQSHPHQQPQHIQHQHLPQYKHELNRGPESKQHHRLEERGDSQQRDIEQLGLDNEHELALKRQNEHVNEREQSEGQQTDTHSNEQYEHEQDLNQAQNINHSETPRELNRVGNTSPGHHSSMHR